MARDVNTVWNYCNQASRDHWRKHRRHLTGFDLNKLCTESSPAFGLIGDSTIQEVGQHYASKRKNSGKSRLRRRVSDRKRRNYSLGWVPFKSRAATFKNGTVRFAGHDFRIWDSYGLGAYAFRAGCFAEDACGRWYFCISVHVEAKPDTEGQPVGIDMGLKETAVASNGLRCTSRWYRRLEEKIATSQRARHKERVKRLHARVRNCRKDAQHKFSTDVIRAASAVYVGNVPVKLLTSGNQAKSGYDAGIYSLKTMLRYKCEHAGIDYQEVSEAFSTQVCSACGALPPTSPKGRADLGVRYWTCCNCGTPHDRDFDAACNIALAGASPSVAGILRLQAGEDVNAVMRRLSLLANAPIAKTERGLLQYQCARNRHLAESQSEPIEDSLNG